jgi:hypothetical protein
MSKPSCTGNAVQAKGTLSCTGNAENLQTSCFVDFQCTIFFNCMCSSTLPLFGKDKDAIVQQYTPRVICKTYIAVIHVAVCQFSIHSIIPFACVPVPWTLPLTTIVNYDKDTTARTTIRKTQQLERTLP